MRYWIEHHLRFHSESERIHARHWREFDAMEAFRRRRRSKFSALQTELSFAADRGHRAYFRRHSIANHVLRFQWNFRAGAIEESVAAACWRHRRHEFEVLRKPERQYGDHREPKFQPVFCQLQSFPGAWRSRRAGLSDRSFLRSAAV